jgi:hypothetical protein
VKTGLMSKVKALFSSRKEMTKPTPKAKKPGRRVKQIRDHWSGTN